MFLGVTPTMITARRNELKCVEIQAMAPAFDPGWYAVDVGDSFKLVAPSTPYDAKGLLKSAIREDNPVMFLTHKRLGGILSKIPDEEYLIPLGQADIKREGSDVTVVAIELMVHRALTAAEKLQEEGISLEVIDPRTLVPLDKQTVID